MQNCKFLSFIPFSFCGSFAASAAKAAPEKEWTEPENSPNVCRTNSYNVHAQPCTHVSRYLVLVVQVSSVRMMAQLRYRGEKTTQTSTALRPPSDDEALDHESRLCLENKLSKNLLNRA
jgi:hypothetical protein